MSAPSDSRISRKWLACARASSRACRHRVINKQMKDLLDEFDTYRHLVFNASSNVYGIEKDGDIVGRNTAKPDEVFLWMKNHNVFTVKGEFTWLDLQIRRNGHEAPVANVFITEEKMKTLTTEVMQSLFLQSFNNQKNVVVGELPSLFVCFHTTSLSGRWLTTLKQFLPRRESLKQGYF